MHYKSAIRISPSLILAAITAHPRKISGETFFPNYGFSFDHVLRLDVSEPMLQMESRGLE